MEDLLSDFKPLREGFFIHLVAFVVATFVTNIILRLFGIALAEASYDVMLFYVGPAIYVLVWPWIISWFRLNSNTGLTIYFGFWVMASPYVIWAFLNAQFPKDVVSQIFTQPTSADALVGLFLTITIWWRLKIIDKSLQEEVSDHNKRLAIQAEEDIAKQALRRSLEQEKCDDTSDQITTLLPYGLPETVEETYRVNPEQREVNDEQFYKAALDEYEENEKVPETWAKALTLCKGDEQSAKWKYIELRVEWLLRH